MSEGRSNITDFLFGLVIGGVLGAGTAILLAPAKGKDTREVINKKLHDLIDEGKYEVETLQEIVKREVEKLSNQKEAFKDAIDKGVETYKSHSEQNG